MRKREKINELIESQRKLVAQQAEEDLIDIFKGISEETRNSNNELKQYQENLDYINRSNPDEFIGALRGFDNNSKSIQLSNNYLSGLDSEIMMNNIASIINDADIIEQELIPQYNEMTEEWFLDLRDITAEDYEPKKIQCIDCGIDVYIENYKDTETCRCEKCREIHQKALRREQNHRYYQSKNKN